MSSTTSLSTRERSKAKAMYIKKKEFMRQQISLRIQRDLGKNPKQSKVLTDMVLRTVADVSRPLSDSELRDKVRDAVAQRREMRDAAETQRQSQSEQARRGSGPGERKSLRSSQGGEAMRAGGRDGGGGGDDDDDGLPRPSRRAPKKRDMWCAIAEFNQVKHEEERREKAEAEEKRRLELRRDLERQVEEKRSRARREEQELHKYAGYVQHDVEAWKEEEQRKRERVLEVNKASIELAERERLAQVAEREKLDARKRAEDQRMLDVLQQQIEEDEERERQRKLAEKAKMEVVLRENDEFLARRQKAKDDDRRRELELAEEYMAMERKKDADREAWLEEQSRRIQAKMKMGAEAIQETQAREDADVERAQQAAADYEVQKAREEKEKKAMLRRRAREQQASLQAQIEAKTKLKERERREMMQLSEKFRLDSLAATREEQEKALELKRRARQHQLQLKSQIREKASRTVAEDQSDLELQLNRTLLRQVQEESARTGIEVPVEIPQLPGLSARSSSRSNPKDLAKRTRERGQQLERQQRDSDASRASRTERQVMRGMAVPGSSRQRRS